MCEEGSGTGSGGEDMSKTILLWVVCAAFPWLVQLLGWIVGVNVSAFLKGYRSGQGEDK